jgi:type II secretory ATPase GspE/PulE/Tfp pilus assembly ATPase PilB-like protein
MAGGPPRPAAIPWQGRILVTIDGRRVRLRVATLPSVYGETCSVRFTAVGARPGDLVSLPLTGAQRQAVREALDAGRGLVLTAGPGGAGSGVTLRALLSSAASTERTAVALEETVDSPLDGVVHVELALQPEASPAAALRTALLHRPDVVMVEDLDEPDTAQAATRAAQKGTLVLADLTANGAAEALVRLFELGIEPFNVASAVQLVVAQRAVRTVCQRCAAPVEAKDVDLRGLGATAAQLEGARLVEPVGCEACSGSGYAGRAPLIEVMRVTEPLRRLLRARAGQEPLRESARMHSGFETIAEAGLRAVLEGRTTAAELRRALA